MDPVSLPARLEICEGCYARLAYLSSGDLNSGPHEFVARASPTGLSPQVLSSAVLRGKENEEALFSESRNKIYSDG